MIIGIGIDIVDINRLEESFQQPGFQARVFSAAELDGVRQYRSKTEHLAGKFAAKEAFMKAIGAGLRQDVWFTQIEVLNTEAGKPYIQASGEAGKRLAEFGAVQTQLSISHSAGVAVAVVIIER